MPNKKLGDVISQTIQSLNTSKKGFVDLKLRAKTGLIQETNNMSNLVNKPKEAALAARMAYHYLVSDFIPYDEMREQRIAKERDKISEAVKKAATNKFKNDKRYRKRGFKNTKEYKSFVERSTNIRTKKMEKDNQKLLEPHLIDDVTIDSRGIRWNRPYAAAVYDNTKADYQQTHPKNFISGVKRTGKWNERALASRKFTYAFEDMLLDAYKESIETGKTPAQIISDKYGYDIS